MFLEVLKIIVLCAVVLSIVESTKQIVQAINKKRTKTE